MNDGGGVVGGGGCVVIGGCASVAGPEIDLEAVNVAVDVEVDGIINGVKRIDPAGFIDIDSRGVNWAEPVAILDESDILYKSLKSNPPIWFSK